MRNVTPTTPLIARVQDEILALVHALSLTTDDGLPSEREISTQLGISRNTVREALRGLAERGLLESRHGSGWFVRPRTDAGVRDLAVHVRLGSITSAQLAEVRNAIEPAIVTAAAIRRSERDLEELDELLQVMITARDDEYAFFRADSRFHEVLARASGNVLFEMAIKPILTAIDETRPNRGGVLQVPGRRDQIVDEHRAMLEAIREGNPEAAKQAMGAHLYGFARLTVPLMDAARNGAATLKVQRPH